MDKKFSELVTATSLSDTDILAGVQGSTSKKFSLSSIASYVFTKGGALTAATGLGDTDTLNGMQGSNSRSFSLSNIASYVASKLFVFSDVLFYDGMANPTIRLVADTASASSTTPWVDNGGHTNPTLGTGGYIRGRVQRIGKNVTLRFSVITSPNGSAVSHADYTTDVTANTFNRASGVGVVNGNYVLVSTLGTTTVATGSIVPDGSYQVINATSTSFQISNDGSTAIDLTGTNATGVTVTAAVFNAGTGIFYRLQLPYNVTAAAQQDQAIIGDGHLFTGKGFAGLGPGDFKDVHFHVANSVDASVCGIVIGTNLSPTTISSSSNYSETNTMADVAYTNVTTSVAGSTIGRTPIGLTNGMLVSVTNLGTTTIPASTRTSGLYIVINASGNTAQLSNDGTTALTFGGTNSSNVHVSFTGRTIDVTGSGVNAVQADEAKTRQYLVDMRQDITAALNTQTGDNVGPLFPCAWTAGMRLIGKMNYESV